MAGKAVRTRNALASRRAVLGPVRIVREPGCGPVCVFLSNASSRYRDDNGATGMAGLTDVQWSVIEPLIEAVRPQTGRELTNLRRTFEAIIWRIENGAK